MTARRGEVCEVVSRVWTSRSYWSFSDSDDSSSETNVCHIHSLSNGNNNLRTIGKNAVHPEECNVDLSTLAAHISETTTLVGESHCRPTWPPCLVNVKLAAEAGVLVPLIDLRPEKHGDGYRQIHPLTFKNSMRLQIVEIDGSDGPLEVFLSLLCVNMNAFGVT